MSIVTSNIEMHHLPSRCFSEKRPSRTPLSPAASSPTMGSLSHISTAARAASNSDRSLEELLSLLQLHKQRSIERCHAFVAEMDAAMTREEAAVMAANIHGGKLSVAERRLCHGSSLPASFSSASLQWVADVDYYRTPSPARPTRPHRRHSCLRHHARRATGENGGSHNDQYHAGRRCESSPAPLSRLSAANDHTASGSERQ